jgi:signal transduction histidine kinase
MKRLFSKKLVYLVVVIISILLAANMVLTYNNNAIIRKNQAIRDEVERTRIYYDQIGKSVIHSIDIGLRGYAIIGTDKFVKPLQNGIAWKDSILLNVETPLKRLNYEFGLYSVFKDSLNTYIRYALELKSMLDAQQVENFRHAFAQDKGAHLWYMYETLEKDIFSFINRIDRQAQAEYADALYRNQLIQILLLVICIPTLLYTAYYTTQSITLSEQLRESEIEKNDLLLMQNESLERKVAERTQEIQAQNEEIYAQTEALSIQNEELTKAQKIIEIQNTEIQQMNEHLKTEVANRTRELREANKELLDQNNKLEQFAFIAAHNLRAPLTRILGLAQLVQIGKEEDREIALEKLVGSTRDLDQVIRDLNTILNIKRQSESFVEVDLEEVLDRVKRTLEKEIESTGTTVIHDFAEASKLYAVAPYVESILYNLISNAIKYRDPERAPLIRISTIQEDQHIVLSIADNGLGIDLTKHSQNVFNLYKRFHLHVEGRGLGLYLVKSQVESMGGKAAIESTPNLGTTFKLYFKRYLL